MTHKTDDEKWKFLPVGENGIQQFVFMSEGRRTKFTENPESPESELAEFIKGKESFSLMLIPPCSYQTLQLAQSVFKKVIIVDYKPGRLNQVDCPDQNKMLVKNEEDFRNQLLKYSDYLNYGSVISYIPARYRKIDQRISTILDKVLIQLQKEQCSFAVNKSLKRWHRNLNSIKNIQNCKELTISLPDIKGQDAVIVGAGPSLDDTVNKLKKYSQNYYIICTDGALKTLMNNEVTPDFIVSCEDSLLSWQFIRQHNKKLKNVHLFAPYDANHYLLKQYTGNLCLTKGVKNEEWAEEVFQDLPIVEPGRCVGHYAFNLAIALNAGRIIMTGFDLSFKGETFHPKDMPVPYFHEMELPVPEMVESIDGKLLKTDLSMLTYLKDFEFMISRCSLKIIDSTEGGAYKRGTEIKSLDELTFKHCKSLLNLKLSHVNLEARFCRLYKQSNEFHDKINAAFTSFLVQNASHVEKELKDEDMESSIFLCKLLVNNIKSKGNRSLLIAETEEEAKEVSDLFGLPQMDFICESSLSRLIQKTRENKINHVYCINGKVPPDLPALENLKCTDLRTNTEKNGLERNLWIDGYECLCLTGDFDFWRNYIPVDISVKCTQKDILIKKVG